IVVNDPHVMRTRLRGRFHPKVEADRSRTGNVVRLANTGLRPEGRHKSFRYVINVHNMSDRCSITRNGYRPPSLRSVKDVGFSVEVVMGTVDYGGSQNCKWKASFFKGFEEKSLTLSLVFRIGSPASPTHYRVFLEHWKFPLVLVDCSSAAMDKPFCSPFKDSDHRLCVFWLLGGYVYDAIELLLFQKIFEPSDVLSIALEVPDTGGLLCRPAVQGRHLITIA